MTAKGTLTRNSKDNSVEVDVTNIVKGTSWAIQYQVQGLNAVKGTTYVLLYYAKATTKVNITTTMCAESSCAYSSDALSSTVGVYSSRVTAKEDGSLKVSLNLGGGISKITIYNVSVAEDGCLGLPDDETIETVKVYPVYNHETEARYIDRKLFLAYMDNKYFEIMRKHLKETLGYSGLVTGTTGFGPAALYGQYNMDLSIHTRTGLILHSQL